MPSKQSAKGGSGKLPSCRENVTSLNIDDARDTDFKQEFTSIKVMLDNRSRICGNCCTYIYYPPNLAITAGSPTNFVGDVSNSFYDQDPDQDQDPVIPTNAFSPG